MSSDTRPQLTNGLDKQSYEIKDELRMRRQIESSTDWRFAFQKNIKYRYDLTVTRWADEPEDRTDSELAGYIELERSRKDREHSWVSGSIPDSWYFYSFLKRKVNQFNKETQSWGTVKPHFDQTVYLKFNHRLGNCFAAPVKAIHEDGNHTPWSDGTKENTYLSLELDDDRVRTGIDECAAFIEEFFDTDDPKPSGEVGLKYFV